MVRFPKQATVLTAALTLVLAVPALAQTPAPATSPNPPAAAAKARFSAANAYMGAPQLPTTLSLVIAGGGPTAFDSKKLIAVLAGDKTQAEVGSLTQKFGADNVASFLQVFNFVVNDSLRYVHEAGIALPATPSPDPANGKALATALYQLGITPSGTFDVEYMLDGLVSHPIHVKVMGDIDAKYGPAADGNYHAVLNQAMLDLKGVYGL